MTEDPADRRSVLRWRRACRERRSSESQVIACASRHPELQGLARNATLGALPLHDSWVRPDAPGEEVHRLFLEDLELPGVVVADGNGIVGLIARQQFFELLGRPFGLEVFLRRDVRTALEGLPNVPLVLPHDCPVRRAARRALERPSFAIHHPVVVRRADGGLGLLSAQVLLLAQNQLLALANDAVEQQLADAQAYVHGLLPPMLTDGPVRTAWRFVPSAQLGGDGFGYHWMDDRRLVLYLLDVSGHGVGPALLSVSTLNVLRSRGLQNVDFGRPAAVARALNDTFQHANHGGLFFTLWYGVLDVATGELDYCCAGHPPAILTPAHRSTWRELRTRDLAIGMLPEVTYSEDRVRVAPGSSLYLFSDGAYEVVTRRGRVWSLAAFREVLAAPCPPGVDDLDRIEATVR
ncbi:MAG: PP2C family protein-serine/threonine phosphatase, partial [Planctomycetota bacterium]